MKTHVKLFFAALAFSAIAACATAEEKPITVSQLPVAAQTFMNSNFNGIAVSYVLMDDDFIRPDYTVALADGSKIVFDNDGRLEKVEAAKTGVPQGIVPVQIMDYVNRHYPDVIVLEYEIDKRHYDVKLSNRLELKFNRNFNLVEVDD